MNGMMFSCWTDICSVGEQFCEKDSQRCRHCNEFEEYCFDPVHHINNCTQFCLDVFKKNITESMTKQYKEEADTYLKEKYHLLIEASMTFIILALVCFCVCPNLKFLLNNLIRKIFRCKASVGHDNSVKFAGGDDDVDLPVKVPLVQEPEVKVEVDSKEPGDDRLQDDTQLLNEKNCGFTLPYQISTATGDQGMLYTSGHRDQETM